MASMPVKPSSLPYSVLNNHKTYKTMQNSKENRGRLHNRVAAGKPPVGVLPTTQKMVLQVL